MTINTLHHAPSNNPTITSPNNPYTIGNIIFLVILAINIGIGISKNCNNIEYIFTFISLLINFADGNTPHTIYKPKYVVKI